MEDGGPKRQVQGLDDVGKIARGCGWAVLKLGLVVERRGFLGLCRDIVIRVDDHDGIIGFRAIRLFHRGWLGGLESLSAAPDQGDAILVAVEEDRGALGRLDRICLDIVDSVVQGISRRGRRSVSLVVAPEGELEKKW